MRYRMSGAPTSPSSLSEEQSHFPHRQTLFILLSLLPLFFIILPPQVNDKLILTSTVRHNVKQPQDIIDLTLSLARIPSPSGHEQQVFKHAEEWLFSQNLKLHKQSVPPVSTSHQPRENLLASYGEINDIEVLLCTHLDTVPGGPPPGVVNDSLIGRGVVDAKGQAAGFMLTLTEMEDPRVGLLLVAGEEYDHKGMIFASEMGISEDVTLLNGEPTEGMVATRQKGMVKGLIKVIGRRAHSGYPHLGDSAVHKLMDVIAELRELWPGNDGETMNVGVIKGGTAANVVAGEAEAEILWRVVHKAEVVIEKVKDIVDGFEDVTFEVITMNDALELFVPDKAARDFGVTEVAYNTDVPYYRGGYKRAIVFGGGSIKVAHTEEEGVAISELTEFGKRVRLLVDELL